MACLVHVNAAIRTVSLCVACVVLLAPEAPHISLVEYFSSVLHVRWTYGDIFTDLSHSRMLHWQVAAEGMRGARRRASANVSFPRRLPRTSQLSAAQLAAADVGS